MKTTGSEFGVNVWWTLPETSVDGKKAQTLLKKHGFEVDDMKLPTRQKEVRRAADSFHDRRHKSNRRVVEKVVDNATEVVYGILDKTQDGEQAAYEQKTTVRLDKRNGCVSAEGLLKDEVGKALPECEGKITEQDIRDFLRKVIRMSYGVAKRPTGGIYFVPAKFAGVIDQARDLIAEFNTSAHIYVEPIVDCQESRANVWDSVEADVEERIAKTIASLDSMARISAIKGKEADITEAQELMKVYQQLLGEEAKFEGVAEKIEDAVRQVSERIAKIQSTAPAKVVKASTKKGSTVVDAALTVLKKASKPMSAHEIVDEAKKLGIYDSKCGDPYVSFNSGLTKAIAKGEKRIERVGRGVYQVAA